jgi:hypothetical protein
VRWLAYAHPLAMTAVLALGLWVLREGLRLRHARLLERPSDSARHSRLARLFVPLVLLGYGTGLLSMAFLRRDPVFDSVHALLTSGATAAFVCAYFLGRRLEANPSGVIRTAHLVCGAGGLLVSLAAAIAGIAILP